MVQHIFVLVFLFCQMGFAETDVLVRARQSGFLPTLSIRYAHREESPHVIWASLVWDFDETLFGDRFAMAIEIKRLEREARYLQNASTLLEQDLAHSID